MKVVILAGGYGTRLADENEIKPKPMIEIGGRPILWHILMQYDFYGYKNFVIALGLKGEMIKRYLVDYFLLQGNLTVNLKSGETVQHDKPRQDWVVDLVDTGIHTKTGGRLKRLAPYLHEGTFMMTWGDSVSDVDIHKLVAFHRHHGKLATITAVRPTARYGYMVFDDEKVVKFTEKSQIERGWINGAYFVLEPEVIDYIDHDDTVWEFDPLERLARDGQLMAFRHTSFWQCVDTPREKQILETLWQSNHAPWKVWED